MKKMTYSLITLLLCFVLAGVAAAQEPLTAGEPVEGEITDSIFTVEYSYKGSADEVIRVILDPVDVLSDLRQPSLILLDPSGKELVRYDSYGTTEIFWNLPADGTYTIIATRTDDAESDDTGNYTLVVESLETLELNAAVERVFNEGDSVYFIYRSEADFDVRYTRDGSYVLQISVNQINSDIVEGTLDAYGVALGKSLTKATFGTFAGGEMYVIGVEEPLFNFYFGEVEPTTVTIELIEAE